jgi:hypothetical protein
MSSKPPPRDHCRGLTDRELVEMMVAEIAACEMPFEVLMSPLNAMQVAGLLQLALRHPHVERQTRVTAAIFIKAVRRYFHAAPALSETFRRGYLGTGCITCPHCGMTSEHPTDIEQRYCGACHHFADDEPVSKTVADLN